MRDGLEGAGQSEGVMIGGQTLRPYTGDAVCDGLESAGESEGVMIGEQTLRPYEVRFRMIPNLQSTIENEMNGVYLEQ